MLGNQAVMFISGKHLKSKTQHERKQGMENSNAIKISENFSFNFKNDVTIGETREVLKKYYSGFEGAFSLKAGYPIFLDTNILLNYYGMSSVDKEMLKTFFTDKVEQIYITQQIEQEFQRNRISAIESYFDELIKIKTDFQKDLQKGIKNQFNNILQSKIVEKDFPEIRISIEKIYEELKEKLFDNERLETSVNSKIDNTIDLHKNLIFLDPILDVYSNFQRIPNLEEDEIDYLKNSYSTNLAIYKNEREASKSKFSFPGCGEKKEKDVWGDYIIFHEIMKFMCHNKKDVIFLTRDVAKSDWLQKTKEPFVHYIEKAYQLTGHLLYIFDATDLLRMISFEDIYQVDNALKNQNEDENKLFYIDQFNKLVDSIEGYFRKNSPKDHTIQRVIDRTILGHDVDIIIERPPEKRNGLLVYDCGSSRKGFRRNIQKRINACNKLINENICDSATLVINLNQKKFGYDFNYELINTENEINIIIGSQDDSRNGEFVKLRSVRI